MKSQGPESTRMAKRMACRCTRNQISPTRGIHFRYPCWTSGPKINRKVFRDKFPLHPQEAQIQTAGTNSDSRDHPSLLRRKYFPGHIHRRNHTSKTRLQLSLFPSQLELGKTIRRRICAFTSRVNKGNSDIQEQTSSYYIHARIAADGEKRCKRGLEPAEAVSRPI